MENNSLRQRRGLIPLAWLAVLWCACVITSTVSFQQRWNTYPSTTDVVLGNTLLAPFAIPKAFGDVVGITKPNSTQGVLLMLACFWPIALTLAGCVLAYRSRLAFGALSVIMLAASLRWQVVACGLIGI
jgi:hypothetical protein